MRWQQRHESHQLVSSRGDEHLYEVQSALPADDVGVAVLFRHGPEDSLRGHPLLRADARLHHVVQEPRGRGDAIALNRHRTRRTPTQTRQSPSNSNGGALQWPMFAYGSHFVNKEVGEGGEINMNLPSTQAQEHDERRQSIERL